MLKGCNSISLASYASSEPEKMYDAISNRICEFFRLTAILHSSAGTRFNFSYGQYWLFSLATY